MEDLLNEFQPLIKHATTSMSDMNSSMELLQNIAELNNPLSSQLFLDYFSTDYLTNPNNSIPKSPYTTAVEGTHQPLLCSLGQSNSRDFCLCGDMNITTTVDVAETPPSPADVGSGSGGSNRIDKTNGIGARKRKRRTEAEGGEKKPKEVIHVRAKRGQATDSHSLAERVRRERINEKLKVLQDLVPGCYKTMGMAVMLDVIINYVRSLQNQIEFLSMKLSAASMFYDFNSPEAEAIETLQKATNNGDAHGAERLVRDGYGEIHPQIHSTWPF